MIKEFKLNRSGFTLIELLAVVVILAVVMVVAIPSVINAMNNAKKRQLQNATDSVSTWLTKQYDMSKVNLGGIRTDASYTNFLSAYGTLERSYEEAVANNKPLSICSSQSYALLTAAGVAEPEKNINIENSYIWINSSNEIDTKLAAKNEGVFYVTGSDNSAYSSENIGATGAVNEFKIYGNSIQNGTPSSSNPVPIQSVGDPTINIYDKSTMTWKQKYIKSDSKKIYTANDGSTLFLIPCKANTTYTISYDYDVHVESGGNTIFRTGYVTNINIPNDTYVNAYNDTLGGPHTLTTGSTAVAIVLQVAGRVRDVIVDSLQVEEGSTATSYKSYYSGYKIPLIVMTGDSRYNVNIYLSEPLRRVGTAADYIDLSTSKVYRNVIVKDNTGTKTIAESFQATVDTTGTSITIPNLPAVNTIRQVFVTSTVRGTVG